MIDPNPKAVQKLAFWARRIYLFVALALTFVEALAIANREKGDTISETVRETFRADTKRGAIVWYCFWVPFAVWFNFHIPKVAYQRVMRRA